MCSLVLVIMAIELYKTRNQLAYLKSRDQEYATKIHEIEQDLAAKDEYLDKLLTDPGKLNRWREAYANHGLELYSFSAHGAPLSPNNTTYLTVRAIPKVKVEFIVPVPLMTWL